MSWTVTPAEKTPVDKQGIGSVSLLLHGDGTNGSTTITDSSPRAKTVTAVGSAQISTAQSKFGGASIAFDGTGDYLETPNSTDFAFGAGNFTIEGWVWTGATATGTIACHRTAGGANNTNWLIQTNVPTQGKIAFYASDGTTYQVNAMASSTNINNSQWNHIAITRSGSTFRLFINGSQEASASWSDSISSTSRVVQIGNDNANSFFNGYIDDLRITKGVARYASNFSVPAAPFPDI